jgi:hypothetical protein
MSLVPEETLQFQNNIFKDLKPVFGNAPSRNKFEGIRKTTGPNTGLLEDQFNLNMNMDAMNALRAQTLNDQASPYVQMQMGEQGLKNQINMQEARKMGNPLLGKGSAEMKASKMMNPAAMINPQLAANQANMDIGLKGRQQQMQRLTAMPQLENQVLAPQQFNITNAMREKEAEDIAKFQGWNEDMKAWAATKQARATAQAGGGGKK